MKRLLILICAAALLAACVVPASHAARTEPTPPPEAPAPDPIAVIDPTADAPEVDAPTSEEPTPAPDEPTPDEPDGLPLVFLYYEQEDWPAEGEMFAFDTDGDGTEEVFSYRLNEDAWTTELSAGNLRYTVIEGAALYGAILIDLDPADGVWNLIVSVDEASDDYVTLELHPENGALVCGGMFYGLCTLENGKLWVSERSDVLGTRFGARTYSGVPLTPDSLWLTEEFIPTAESIARERSELIEVGVLLITARELPCTIDGEAVRLPKGTALWVTGFKADDSEVSVKLEDGRTALIAIECEEEFGYRIAGVPQEEYFENLFYAD